MDPTEGIGNQQEQIGLESDSLESAAVALATGVTRRRQRTEKGKSYIAHLSTIHTTYKVWCQSFLSRFKTDGGERPIKGDLLEERSLRLMIS